MTKVKNLQARIDECSQNILRFNRDEKMRLFWLNAFNEFFERKRKLENQNLKEKQELILQHNIEYVANLREALKKNE